MPKDIKQWVSDAAYIWEGVKVNTDGYTLQTMNKMTVQASTLKGKLDL